MGTVHQPEIDGLVRLRSELLEDGYTDYQLTRLVRAGVLHRVRHGAYVDMSLWKDLASPDRHRLLSRAVLRTAHPSAVLSHVSAAVERGIPVWNVDLDEVHITRTDGKGSRREAGVVHHVGQLDDADVEMVNGVRVTRAPRCAVEVIATATTEVALVVVNGMLHCGILSRTDLAAAVSTMKRWPRTLSAHRVTAMADHRMESVAETRTYFMCRQHGLPSPEPQVEVRDEWGQLFARVDFAWIHLGVFLEFDGRLKYDQLRREGETLDEFLMREKRREERICQLTGWVCIRIGWADLERPAATTLRIRRILESRRDPTVA